MLLAVVRDRFIEALFDVGVGILVAVAAIYLLAKLFRGGHQENGTADDDGPGPGGRRW
jgi:hypothetical protein